MSVVQKNVPVIHKQDNKIPRFANTDGRVNELVMVFATATRTDPAEGCTRIRALLATNIVYGDNILAPSFIVARHCASAVNKITIESDVLCF